MNFVGNIVYIHMHCLAYITGYVMSPYRYYMRRMTSAKFSTYLWICIWLFTSPLALQSYLYHEDLSPSRPLTTAIQEMNLVGIHYYDVPRAIFSYPVIAQFFIICTNHLYHFQFFQHFFFFPGENRK